MRKGKVRSRSRLLVGCGGVIFTAVAEALAMRFFLALIEVVAYVEAFLVRLPVDYCVCWTFEKGLPLFPGTKLAL